MINPAPWNVSNQMQSVALPFGSRTRLDDEALILFTSVFNPELRCLHARTPFDAAYMSKRMDSEASVKALERRYGP